MKYLIIMLFFFVNIFSQEKIINGSVFNSETFSPLFDVLVKANDTLTLTTSDKQGKFSLKINNKLKTLLFSIVGYETKLLSLDSLFNTSDFNFLNIFLKPKLLSAQTILVSASIGDKSSAFTFSKLNKEVIKNEFIIQDIPEFLSNLPSTTFYTESGNNVGYSYINIRGFDQRRISVAINGVPQNDPEDHNVYWIDFPDLLENTDIIQVQRGAGSGIIGYPSVGGSINIITSDFTPQPKFILESSFGSFNTKKITASFSSGLINNSLSIFGRLSSIKSDGYRNSAWSDFFSFYLALQKTLTNFSTQINFYGGPIRDGLVYNGIAKFALKDLSLRKENLSYWEAYNNQYTYKNTRRSQEAEYYSQPHFELLNEYKPTENLTFNSCLFYISGNGYYDYDASWADTNYFRITSEFGFSPTKNPDNSLIRASVENNQFGWMPKINLKFDFFDLTVGSELRFHRSLHSGRILYANSLPEKFPSDYDYYEYKGGKDIFNFFIHSKINISEQLKLNAEIQTAYFKYKIFDEKFIGNNFSISHFFINPKIGLNYQFSELLSSYISLARVTREPRLKNYYDAAESSGGEIPQFEINQYGNYDFNLPLVNPETMNNLELGTSFSSEIFNFSANYYFMYFQNEIVKNGKLDRFGQPKTGNADETIHSGLELASSLKISSELDFNFNFTYSNNHIKKSSVFLNYNNSIQMIDLNNNQVSGFPNLLFNVGLKYNSSNLLVKVDLKYVGEYYSDNYGENLKSLLEKYPDIIDYNDNKVESYIVSNFLINYKLNNVLFFEEIKTGFQINNLFNNLYCSNAFGKEFFPAAERNFLFFLQIGL